MKILLIQVDGKFPNLALMKIGAYHKVIGDKVGWAFASPDKVYISCVFSQNLPHAKGIKEFYPGAEVLIGGPALGYPHELPNKIEMIRPDYSLYPDIDYSLGFTTRGCIRNCAFCVVPKIEGVFKQHKHPDIFHNPEFNKIVLLDNNFLASRFREVDLNWIQDQGLKVCFNQGLDARLVNEGIARVLADTDAYNFRFTDPQYYFAWDFIENEREIMRGLNYMIEAGVKPRYLTVFVLVGFNTTHEQDVYRFKTLDDMGIDPFIMKYNHRKDDPWLNHFARYINKRVYRSVDLGDYRPYNLANDIMGV
jgi:hypothetical protein